MLAWLANDGEKKYKRNSKQINKAGKETKLKHLCKSVGRVCVCLRDFFEVVNPTAQVM